MVGSAGYSSPLRFPSPFPYPQEVRRGACTAWQGGLLGPRWGRDAALLTLPSAGKQGPRLWARTECGPLLRAAPSGEVLPAQTGLASPRGVPGLRPKLSGPRACVGRGPPRRGLTRVARVPAPSPPPAPRGLVAPPPGRWVRPPLIGRARASVLVAPGHPQRERSAAARPVRLGCGVRAGRRP